MSLWTSRTTSWMSRMITVKFEAKDKMGYLLRDLSDLRE